MGSENRTPWLSDNSTMRNSILPLLLALATASCQSTASEQPGSATSDHDMPAAQATKTESALDRYAVEAYFPGTAKDSLLVDMITFIHKRPNAAINRDRALPEFRTYYIEELPRYSYAYHRMTPDSTHWFYILRPARSVDGTLRGVGGHFRRTRDGTLVEFEEIFNTKVLPREVLLEQGLILFEQMVEQGNVENFPERDRWVEWPDERLKYDPTKHEWRYLD